MRFLAEDVSKRLDIVLDAIMRVLTRSKVPLLQKMNLFLNFISFNLNPSFRSR
ncbi:hypothetical protein, partial [Legionella oakridgensis]|uniref:hypothetical protein n=1 Tax=Legionella oakridgensis TaxID=29423 RepID=UPI001930D510